MAESITTDQSIDLDVQIFQRAAEILKTIGHPIRLRIVYCLDSGERTVTEIQEAIGQPQAITSASSWVDSMVPFGRRTARFPQSLVNSGMYRPDVSAHQ